MGEMEECIDDEGRANFLRAIKKRVCDMKGKSPTRWPTAS